MQFDVIDGVNRLAHLEFKLLGPNDYVDLETNMTFVHVDTDYHTDNYSYKQHPATQEEIELEIFYRKLIELRQIVRNR